MKSIIVLVISLCLFSNIVANDEIETLTNCFETKVKIVPIKETITVYLADGTILRGTNPSVMKPPSLLYLKELNTMNMQMIPINDINRIIYTKHNRKWGKSGMIVGGIVGIFAGYALSPEPEKKTFGPDLKPGFLGMIAGGFVGSFIGSIIDKKLDINVVIICK